MENIGVAGDDLGHLQEDVGRLLGVVEWRDGRVAGGQRQVVVHAVAVEGRLVALQVGGIGQDDVRPGRGVRGQHLDHHHQLDVVVPQGLLPARVGVVVTHRVGGVDEEGAGQVGLVLEFDAPFDRFLEPGLGHHRQRHVEAAGGFFLRVPGPGPAGVAVGEILALGERADDHLREGHAGERRQRRAHLVAVLHGLIHMRGLVVDLGRVHPAAGAVEPAGERLDHRLDAAQHHDIAVAGTVPARIDDRRAGGAELVGDARNVRRGDAGDVRRPLRRVGRQLLELGLEHRHDRAPIQTEGLGTQQRRGEGLAFQIQRIVVAEGLERADLAGAFHQNLRMPLGVRQQPQLARVVAVSQEGHVAVLAQEARVVEPVLHEDAHHGEQEGQIRPRLDLKPLVRLGGGLGAPRIQADDLRALLAPLGKAHHAAGRDRADRGVVADEENVFGVVEVRQHLVMDVEVAGDHVGAEMASRHAMLHGRGDDVRHLVGHGKGHRPVHVEDAGGPAADHGPFPGLDLGRLALFGDVRVCLLPARGAEGILAALAALDPDQRGFQPVGVIGLAQPGLAARADLAAIQRGMRVAVKLDDALLAIAGATGDPKIAQRRAKITDAVRDLLLHVFFGNRILDGVGDRRKECEPSGAKTGGFQERTTGQARNAPGHGDVLQGSR